MLASIGGEKRFRNFENRIGGGCGGDQSGGRYRAAFSLKKKIDAAWQIKPRSTKATHAGDGDRSQALHTALLFDIKAAIEGMLEPKLKKNFLGKVEVRKVFKLSRSGIIAGSFVSKGKVTRSSHVDVVRNGEVVFEGKISSLKRFKDDVREVAEGYECGIAVAGFEAIKEGDIIQAYEIEKIARKLGRWLRKNAY